MIKDVQAKSIADAAIMAVIPRDRWGVPWDIEAALSEYPPKVVRAKLRALIRRKMISGCACGCRGDFQWTEKTA